MHENKPFKSHEYAPIKYPHTYLLLVLEQNKTTKEHETRQNEQNTTYTFQQSSHGFPMHMTS